MTTVGVASDGSPAPCDHFEEIGGSFVYSWIWEYLLRYTRLGGSRDGIPESFKEGFPVSVERLVQMQYLKQLENISEGHEFHCEVVLRSVRCLDSFQDSLVGDGAANLQQAHWGPGSKQLSLEKEALQPHITALRGGLLDLKKREDAEDVRRRAKHMLGKFCGVVWPMFGPLALTVFAAGVVAERLGGQPYMLEEACKAGLRMGELLEAFQSLGDDNRALKRQIEEETDALNALQGRGARLQGGKHTFLRVKMEAARVESHVKSVQYFSKPDSVVGWHSDFTKKALKTPPGGSTPMSLKTPKRPEQAPIRANPSKRCRSESDGGEEEGEDEEDGCTVPLKGAPLPDTKGRGLQAKTEAPASGTGGVNKKGRGIFTKEMDKAIREGVGQHGQHGNIRWKMIRNQHPKLLGRMTPAQLKDRNKNLEKQKKAQVSYD